MSAAVEAGLPTRRGVLEGAVRWLAIAALPLCVSSPGGTVALALLGLAGLVFLRRGVRPAPEVRRLFRWAAGLYLFLLAVDIVNGAPVRSLLSTGVNYLPLIAIVPAHVALRAARVGEGEIMLGFRLAVLAALALAVPSVASLVEGGRFMPVTGLNLNQIPFGLVMALMSVVLLSRALEGSGSRPWADALAAGLVAAVVVLTQSKLAWGSLGVGWLALGILYARRLGPWRLGAALVGAASVAALLLALPPVRGELAQLGDALRRVAAGDLSDGTLGRRILIYKGSWVAFMERPVLGWGLPGQMDVVKGFIAQMSDIRMPATHLHSDWFRHLVGYGLFGAVFLAGFFLFVVRLARVAEPVHMRRALIAALPAIALYMSFDVFFNMDALTGFFALLLAMALPRDGDMA
ncbi:O-antigen ligase [Meinhardsimonia xiamenensis]|jgi:O-antigen ligase|uniref:O-antigen ligase n=1 Tax=Meinhardsimonia xiamenensis TaxID=990712 RepID=A0A1G9HDS7_9RHOB|nr:O-antigen ligase family protein [Meinhardsimonia xiamenensis]PRX28376.1 O-antigen ligase [Meinhardsimonia xiamenensis]SDL10986.1 O-antigen ligase [Meinhardsimonia xiamenensis]